MSKSGFVSLLISAVLWSGFAQAQGLPPIRGMPAFSGENGPINCTIQPIQTVEVRSQIRGIVEKVLVRPGQSVVKGDPLALLDTDIARSDMMLAEARASADASLKAAITKRDGLAKKEARMRGALKTKAVSRADYEAAALELALAETDIQREEQSLAVARLDYERSKMLVEKSTIKSPVDGVVGEDLVDPGESINDRPIAVIYVTKPLRVEAFIPVDLLASYAKQKHFLIEIDGSSGKAVEVKLDHFSQIADLSSNTVSLFFTLNDSNVLPGSKCTLTPPNL